MIIIEGADGSGKTTLANLIMAAFPRYRMIHSPGPLKIENVQERVFWNTELTKLDYVIADRISMVSERIYGPIIRKASLIGIAQFSEFLTSFRNNNDRKNILVFCDSEFEPIKKDHGAIHMDKKEKLKLEDEVEDKLQIIRENYRSFFLSLYSSHQSLNSVVIKDADDIISLITIIRSTYEH